MNSLQDLRKVFEDCGKEVTDFTGFSMKADGHTWGIVHDNVVCDGEVFSIMIWKEYLKALRSNKPRPYFKPKPPNAFDDAAKALGIFPVGKVK